MNKESEINRVRYVVENNGLDVEDLVCFLEITVEDVLDRFEDRMYDHREKFIPDGYMIEEEDYVEQEEEAS